MDSLKPKKENKDSQKNGEDVTKPEDSLTPPPPSPPVDEKKDEKGPEYKTPLPPEESEKKGEESKPIDMSKPYKTADGQFGEHGMIKYYMKDKKRKQIEKDNKMVFADDGTECSYFPNLLPNEVKKRREAGEIF